MFGMRPECFSWTLHLQGFIYFVDAQASTVVGVKGLEGLLVGSLLLQAVEINCGSNKFFIVNSACKKGLKIALRITYTPQVFCPDR